MTDLHPVINTALEALLVPVGAVTAGYVIVLLHKLGKKIGLEVTAETELQVRAATQNAILAVEELARARLKATGKPTAPEVKRHDAITLTQHRLPDKKPDEVTQLVNEELPKVRASLQPAVVAPIVPVVPTPRSESVKSD